MRGGLISTINRMKTWADYYIDPAWATFTANLGTIAIGNEIIQANAETGIENVLGYTALTAAVIGLNKILPKVTEKIKEQAYWKKDNGIKADWKSYVKTAGQALATGILAYTLVTGVPKPEFKERPILEEVMDQQEFERIVHSSRDVLEKYPAQPQTFEVPENLKGKMFNDLYSQYTGLKSFPKKGDVSIDYHKEMADMWTKKLDFIRKRIDKGLESGNPAVPQTVRERVSKYFHSNKTLMSLDQYISEADNTIDDFNKVVNWDVVGEELGLNKQKTKLLKDIALSLDGNDIVAYQLTELMPSKNGSFNAEFFDFLLRTAGREYVELIPAMSDRWASFGPAQFTSYAVYEHDGDQRGANRINEALPENMKLPGSVIKLEGNQHHQAAYQFAITNIGDLLRGMSQKNLVKLSKNWKDNDLGITQYIATSHHRPRDARKAATYWTANNASKDFTVSCNRRIKGYSKKSKANYKALNRR